jgi:RNA polymerase sigma factor (sigma-70 family)
MTMNHDAELLRRYAEEQSEAAFAEFVRQHAGLVYASALRRLGGDAHAASDVVQDVFVSVARNIRKLTHCAHLSSWLFAATRNAALNHMRDEIRRKQRERKAYDERIGLSEEGAEVNWEKLRPVLDQTLDELREPDREAVLLRFLENRPYAEIGERLRLTENAARMRVERALVQLRSRLARRGIHSTAAGLATLVSGYAATPVPPGVISAATSAALAAGTPAAVTGIGMVLVNAKVVALGVAAAVAVAVIVSVGALLPRSETVAPVQHVGAQTEGMEIASPDAGAPAQSLHGARGTTVDSRAARIAYERALKLEQAREYAAAIALYSQATSHDPGMFDAYFARARIYQFLLPLEKRNYAKARDDYTRCLEIYPRDYGARYYRALCLEYLREYDSALADYTAIIEGDTDLSRWGPGGADALALAREARGRLRHERQRDPAGALDDYAVALQLNPNSDTLHYRRAIAYHALKNYPAAEAEFTTAYERNPDSANLLARWAWQLATAPEAGYRDGKAALEFASRANERSGSKVSEHLEALAAAWAENGRFDHAVEIQRKAIAAARLPYQLKKVPAMEERLSLYRAQKPYRDAGSPPQP